MGNRILDWMGEHVMPWLIIVLIAASLVFLGWLGVYGYRAYKSPTMSLRKADWHCTRKDWVPVTTMVPSGKSVVPVTTFAEQCDQWSRL